MPTTRPSPRTGGVAAVPSSIERLASPDERYEASFEKLDRLPLFVGRSTDRFLPSPDNETANPMVGKLFDHHAPLRAFALVGAVLTFATPGSASTVQSGQGGIFSLGEKLIERAFDVPDGGSLHIEFPEIRFINAEDVITTNISIKTGATNVVEIDIYYVSGRMDWARGVAQSVRPAPTRDGATVMVEYRGDRLRFEQPSWAHSLTFFIEARIPEDYNVSVRNHHGEITLERLNGSATLESVSGDIHVGAVRGAAVSLSTQDGSIAADHLDAEGATTTLRSAKGNVSLGIQQLAATTLIAGDGDILIRAPASLSANVYFEGDDIDVDEAFTLEARASSTVIEGAIGVGGARLEAMGSGGTIRLLPTGSGSER